MCVCVCVCVHLTPSGMEYVRVLLLLLALIPVSTGLDNGLLRTPPMGWMAWERFRCDIDCNDDPENCIRYLSHPDVLWFSRNDLMNIPLVSMMSLFHSCRFE